MLVATQNHERVPNVLGDELNRALLSRKQALDSCAELARGGRGLRLLAAGLDDLRLRAEQVHRQEEPDRGTGQPAGSQEARHHRGRDQDQGLPVRLSHLALLHREATDGRPR